MAGAIWTQVDLEPVDDVRRWALRTREVLGHLALDPATGVHRLTMHEYEPFDPGPTWWETTPFGRSAGFRIDGTITVPEVHLTWLERRLADLGGSVTVRRLRRLEEASGDVVVNCTGLGSAELTGDTSLVPIRGQVVHVANPGLTIGIADEIGPTDVTYLYPRPGRVVLGGIRWPVIPASGHGIDLRPDPVVTARILADTAAHDPRLAGLAVEQVRVPAGVGMRRTGRGPRGSGDALSVALTPPPSLRTGRGGFPSSVGTTGR